MDRNKIFGISECFPREYLSMFNLLLMFNPIKNNFFTLDDVMNLPVERNNTVGYTREEAEMFIKCSIEENLTYEIKE